MTLLFVSPSPHPSQTLFFSFNKFDKRNQSILHLKISSIFLYKRNKAGRSYGRLRRRWGQFAGDCCNPRKYARAPPLRDQLPTVPFCLFDSLYFHSPFCRPRLRCTAVAWLLPTPTVGFAARGHLWRAAALRCAPYPRCRVEHSSSHAKKKVQSIEKERERRGGAVQRACFNRGRTRPPATRLDTPIADRPVAEQERALCMPWSPPF